MCIHVRVIALCDFKSCKRVDVNYLCVFVILFNTLFKLYV